MQDKIKEIHDNLKKYMNDTYAPVKTDKLAVSEIDAILLDRMKKDIFNRIEQLKTAELLKLRELIDKRRS